MLPAVVGLTEWYEHQQTDHGTSVPESTTTVVDNIIRAVPNMTAHARELQTVDRETLEEIVAEFDPAAALAAAEAAIRNGDLD
jgi:4-phosphopantoate--beta-alanine ligase